MKGFKKVLLIALLGVSFVVSSNSKGLEIPLSELFVEEVEDGPVRVATARPKVQVMATCPKDGVFGVGPCSRTWFQCVAGQDIPAQDCGPGRAFNNVPGAYNCLPEDRVAGCRTGASCQGAGLFPVRKYACEQMFMNCPGKGAAGYIQPCAAGLYFSHVSKHCDQKECPTCPNPRCAGGPGKFAVPKKRRYRLCPTKCGPHTLVTCPRGTRFNANRQMCE